MTVRLESSVAAAGGAPASRSLQCGCPAESTDTRSMSTYSNAASPRSRTEPSSLAFEASRTGPVHVAAVSAEPDLLARGVADAECDVDLAAVVANGGLLASDEPSAHAVASRPSPVRTTAVPRRARPVLHGLSFMRTRPIVGPEK